MIKKLIVLDTETTGLEVDQGHRIIEIGAVLLEDRKKQINIFTHISTLSGLSTRKLKKSMVFQMRRLKTNLNSLRLQKAFWSLSRAVF